MKFYKRLVAALLAAVILGAPMASAREVAERTAERSEETVSASFDEAFPHSIGYKDLDARSTGYTNTLEDYGIKNIYEWLHSHEKDNYYLGSPSMSGDFMSPRGDPQRWDNGAVGTNCAGFVAHVLMKCGLTLSVRDKMLANDRKCTNPRARLSGWSGSNKPYSHFTAASDYYTHIMGNKLQAYVYRSFNDMFRDKKARNGDVLLCFRNFPGGLSQGEDNHISIYWGYTKKGNKETWVNNVWHTSAGMNRIGPMRDMGAQCIVLIKAKPLFVKPDPDTGFNDVPKTSYYYDAVKWAVESNITSGTEKYKFSPNDKCTRAEAVTFLWRAMGCPEPKWNNETFSDVPEGAYYETAVKWAVEKNITSGTEEDLFGPDEKCTRGQIVTFLWRAAGKPYVSQSESVFEDVDPEEYYVKAINWAYEKGISKGTEENLFEPEARCTRSDIVTFLYRSREE